MIRILLVEDDPVIRDTTSYFLKCQQNFEVVCADTGGEALSHAREKFDVILMDILLPDTNGMDLCQRLRSWHHCPIIFTSCLDDTDTVVRALELGGDDFLTKPYNHKVLLARIMANIRRVQMDAAEPSVRSREWSRCPWDTDTAPVRAAHSRIPARTVTVKNPRRKKTLQPELPTGARMITRAQRVSTVRYSRKYPSSF